MLRLVLIACVALAGCAGAPNAPISGAITHSDIAMNRPNSDTPEALFRMLPDGTGTVDFTSGVSGPQPVTWSLRGDVFCIDTANGLMDGFGCAKAQISGHDITLKHTSSDGVVTGVLVPR